MINEYPELLNHWYIVCQSGQLRTKPLKRTLLGMPLVLFRSANGTAVALSDRCPHRNAPLSAGWVNEGRIVCPYHGWQFGGEGACQLVPGLCGESVHPSRSVLSFPTIEQDGLVWVFPRQNPDSVPKQFAYLNRSGYTHFVGELTMTGALPDALENFLDGTHTHFVHSGLIRTEGKRKQVSAIVRRKIDSVEAQYPDEGQQSGVISKLFGAGIDDVYGRFVLPSLAQLEYRSRSTTRMLITLGFTPETDDALRVFAVVVGQAPAFVGWLAKPILQLLFWQAFQQDRKIVELQTANVKRFGGEQYVYTDLDLLRPHIVRLLKHGPFAADDLSERRVTMLM